MINLIQVPQRSDIEFKYKINKDVLEVTIDNVTETFDFTGLNEGIAKEIIVEVLPFNPILSAEKIGDTINVKVIRFYGADEKELFENGNN